MICGLKSRNIRYSLDYQWLNPQQICNKSATGLQQPYLAHGLAVCHGRRAGSPCACNP
jgi:hypothetical protein